MSKITCFFGSAVFATVLLLGVGAPTAQAMGLSSTSISAIVSLLKAFGVDQSTINNVQTVLNGDTTSAAKVSSGVVQPSLSISSSSPETDKHCLRIVGSGKKGMDIFFVGSNYSSGNILYNGHYNLNDFSVNLENDVMRLLYSTDYNFGYGLLTIEPFVSNLDKVNVYLITEPFQSDWTQGYGYFDTGKTLVKEYCNTIYTPDDVIGIINADPLACGAGGGIIGTSGTFNRKDCGGDYKYVGATFVHELGHAFGLYDNYSTPYQSNGLMKSSAAAPNCDNTAGCPKWCSGSPVPASDILTQMKNQYDSFLCTNYSTKEVCEQHSASGLINEDCLWLPQKDPYFNSQCIKNSNIMGDPNLGTSCLEGTGCYWGSSSAGYRPEPQNNFANIFSQKIDSGGRKHTFEPVSERFLGEIFECCYPQDNKNYNSAKCSNFAGTYSKYSFCAYSEAEPVPQPVHSCAPPTPLWGGNILSGNYVTAFQSTSVVSPAGCVSQTRTCTNGTLSGSYTNQSCSVTTPVPQPAVSCSPPWGGTIESGNQISAALVPSVVSPATCTYQTRTCNNGILSGSYTNQNCVVTTPVLQPTVSCSPPWGGTVESSKQVTAFRTSSVVSPATCDSVSQTSTCTNGTLSPASGVYTNQNCVVTTPVPQPAVSCTLPWGGSILSGNYVTAFKEPFVAGWLGFCMSEKRTCTNGSLSGSYGYKTCSLFASALSAVEGLTQNSSAPQSQTVFTYVWNNNLQIGSPYATDITALQIALTKESVYAGEITGGFYNQTFTAVKAFQQKYGINATGFVGPKTRSELNSLYSK